MGVEPLPGGLGNGGRVVRVGATVRRPHGAHSTAIFELLAHLERRAFPAPLPVETAPGEDVLATTAASARRCVRVPERDREQLVEAIVEGKRIGIEFVRRRVLAGETAFVQMWERRGGADGEQRAMEWLRDQRSRLLEALTARVRSNKP